MFVGTDDDVIYSSQFLPVNVAYIYHSVRMVHTFYVYLSRYVIYDLHLTMYVLRTSELRYVQINVTALTQIRLAKITRTTQKKM